MKQIIIISDTHLPKKKKGLPEKLIEKIKKSDYLIHAGDFGSFGVYEELSKLTKVIGVYGNVDDYTLQERLPLKRVFKIENVTIGLTHGHGRVTSTRKRVLELFKDDTVDIIIYGHSHIPILERLDDVILFNPGSPTDKRLQKYYSYGMMLIDNGKFELNHIVYNKEEVEEQDDKIIYM